MKVLKRNQFLKYAGLVASSLLISNCGITFGPGIGSVQTTQAPDEFSYWIGEYSFLP